jgi:hypothetical protein
VSALSQVPNSLIASIDKRLWVTKGRRDLVSSFGTVVADLFTVLVLPDISVPCHAVRHNCPYWS